MSSPIASESLTGATATGPGAGVMLLGHAHVGLMVQTDADPTTLEARLEVSVDGNAWAPARTVGGAVEVVTADFTADENGNWAAHMAAPGPFAQYGRVNVTGYGTAGNVDAYVLAAGNAGQGRKATGRSGPVTDL